MKIRMILLIFFLAVSVKSELLTTTCTGLTCSPAQCLSVTNPACTAVSKVNITSSIAALKCLSTITQSTNPLCSNSELRSTFAKGIGFGLKAAYCNDKYLVILSDGAPNHDDTLALIPHPPGDSSSGNGYANQCVTRKRVTQFFKFKIPLNPVELPTASLSNNVNSFVGNKLPTVPMPSSGPVGVTVSGLPIFPAYNDQEELAWSKCEMDACNAHAGQGNDYHYHGDPYGPNCMYSSADYASATAHPPLIGFSLDGFKIYGRYLDANADGYSTALDICGGHSHGTLGYHYHSQVLSKTSTSSSFGIPVGQAYTVYIAGPYQCWKGDISSVDVWDTAGSIVSYKPSCTMTDYYQAPEVTLSINSATTTTVKATRPKI